VTTKQLPERITWGRQSPDGQVLLSMPWEVFVLGVSLLSIINLVLILLVRDPDIEQVVILMDSVLVSIFLVDFVRRLRVAQDDLAYLIQGKGWLDLISILPMLRIARILRMVRVTRVVQRMGGPEIVVKAFFVNRASGSLFIVIIIALLVLEFGSLLVLRAEAGAEGANILTASDAIWYSLVTMSTVGYGDRFPVTELGRFFGALTIIVGVGVFGTLTGFLANAFLAPRGGDAAAEPLDPQPEETHDLAPGPEATETEA
jgi:voltage-gated potassium channel